MDQNPNDNQNQDGGGVVPDVPVAPAMGDQGAAEEKCHCGRAVASGSCSGCNAPSATCTCAPEAPAGGEPPAGEPPAAPPAV